MKKLLIAGAGGLGREVLAWARQTRSVSGEWEVVGFLDDNPDALRDFDCPVPIVGAASEPPRGLADGFVLGVGQPKTRLRLAERLCAEGLEAVTLVHPTVVLGDRVEMGRGCVLCPYAVVTCDVRLGDFVLLNLAATVGHNAVIGDGTTLSCHADVTGYVRIGRGVFLGSHASVLPSVEVGDFAVVGAGSVASRRVRPGVTVAGVPATRLGWSGAASLPD